MNSKLQTALPNICSELIQAIFNTFLEEPIGCCYLIGHCLSEGLSKAGYSAKETTGHLLLKGKNGKNIIYGTAKHKGILVGYYHTWCVLDDGEPIIIDPSLHYNKLALRNMGIKLDAAVPSVVISSKMRGAEYSYIEDVKLVPKSKDNLKNIKPNVLEQLIEVVTRSTKKAFEQ